MSLSRIHCCYIIIDTEFKEKHTFEQDELFCCVIISSGLNEKKYFFYVTKTKSYGLCGRGRGWEDLGEWH